MSTVQEKVKLIVGTPIRLGTKNYVCPALNLKGMKLFKDELRLLQNGVPVDQQSDNEATEQYMQTLVTVTHAALLRNYPDVTTDDIEEGLDFNNLKTVALAVLGVSGFKTLTEEEARTHLEGTESGEPTGTA